MPKAFLSYSSKQKGFVSKIAEALGNSKCFIDYKSFEEGMLAMEEIVTLLDKTNLFVLFLSDSALKSPWVKDELSIAKDKYDSNLISRIYPLIIDKNITHEDDRIPQWMRDKLNIQPVLREGKAIMLIKRRLREISWDHHPKLKEKEAVFRGRNELIDVFEQRFDSIDKASPICIVAAGLPKIGRKSFLKNALKKTNTIIKDSYEPLTITFNSRESIEDFILKVYDLGLSEERQFPVFLETPMVDKINIAKELIIDIQKANELLFVEDSGGIVSYDRVIVDWFRQLISSDEKFVTENKPTICIASRFRILPQYLVHQENIFQLEIPELSVAERTGLLKRLAEIDGLSLTREDIMHFVPYLNGFPDQILFTTDLISQAGLPVAKKQTDLIIDYTKERISKIIDEIKQDEVSKDLLYLLTDFDFISFDLLFQILDGGDVGKYEEKIDKFKGASIIEMFGVNKEYLRLNDAVRDFLQRAGAKLPDKYKVKLKNHLREFLKQDNLVTSDISDFFYSLRGALLQDFKFKNKYLLPSHYLKTMIHLYEREKNYTDVISLAKRVLEREDKIDLSIQKEIKYWLCLSLARLKDDRFKEEVQYFREFSDYDFLMGFYYRMIGKPDYAINNLLKVLSNRPRFPRARRELVQVFLNLQMYDEAFDHSKINYENDGNNPYHVQAYFDCLIRRTDSTQNKITLKNLIVELEKINTPKSLEMASIASADYWLIIENNPKEAFKKINETLEKFGPSPYSIARKFNIVEKTHDIKEMESVISEFEKKMKNTPNEKNVLNLMKAKYYGHKNNKVKAFAIIDNDLQFFPSNTKDRLKGYIERL